MEKVRIAVVGYGQRGSTVTTATLHRIPAVEVTAICDLYQDRVDKGVKVCEEKYGIRVFGTQDYREILDLEQVDAVYVATSWEYHVEIAIEAMKKGKAVALEVGGAYHLDELSQLVRTYEATKTPIMFMENCCFDQFELLATAVARSGKLGDIVHCHGSYAHDLRQEISSGNIIRHYRLRNYTSRNCENYPTHELGPIAKLLNINRGNRMLSLVSVASRAKGLEQYVKDHPELVEQDSTLAGRIFSQGDIVNTIITCAGGETILLRLDTTLPRPYYSREFGVRGTKGFCNKDTETIYLDGEKDYWVTADGIEHYLRCANAYKDEFLPAIWKDIPPEDLEEGHDAMDMLEFKAFVDCLLQGKEMPIDVYDAAAWMAITVLSEQSIQMGGAPQAIPDFTDGKWILREPRDVIDL
jgi:predicted dehydrogenase